MGRRAALCHITIFASTGENKRRRRSREQHGKKRGQTRRHARARHAARVAHYLACPTFLGKEEGACPAHLPATTSARQNMTQGKGE